MDVCYPYVIASKTHWLKTFLFRLVGRYLPRKISLYFPETFHLAFILSETSCLVLFFIAVVCPRYLWLVAFSISVVFLLVFDLVFPLCILRTIVKLSSFTAFK